MARALEENILLLPLGHFDPDDLGMIAEGIEAQFDLRVRIGAGQEAPSHALDPVRKQYNSNLILKRLEEMNFPGISKILGVTNFDLFSPIFSYVFGEAQFGGRCAVISSYRLRGRGDGNGSHGCPPLVHRLEKEAIHELGHTFGLRHCSDPDCVMRYSTGVQCADRKFVYLCSTCRDLVEWNRNGRNGRRPEAV